MIDIEVPAQGAAQAPETNTEATPTTVVNQSPAPSSEPMPETPVVDPVEPRPQLDAAYPEQPAVHPTLAEIQNKAQNIDDRMRDRMERLLPDSSSVALSLRGADGASAYQNVVLAQQTGRTQQFVAADPQAVQEEVKRQNTIDALTGFPSTARWALQNPESAKVAQEDWGEFTAMEANARAWSGLRSAVGEAVDNTTAGWRVGEMVAQVGESFYRDPNSERSQALNRQYEAMNADITPEQQESVFFTMGQILGTMAHSGQSMARGAAMVTIPAIAASAATGPLAPAAVGAMAAGAGLVAVWNSTCEIEAGMFLRDAMARGVAPEDARSTAEVVGAINGLLEAGSDAVMGKLFAPIAKNMLKSVVEKTALSRIVPNFNVAPALRRPTRLGVLGSMGVATGANATTEATTEILQDITSNYASNILDVAQGLQAKNALHTPEGREALWEQTKQSWWQIWKASALLGTAFSAVGLPSNLRQAQDAAMAQHDFVAALNAAKQSGMGQKYPEVVAQYQTNTLQEQGVDAVFVDNTAFAQAMKDTNVTLDDLQRIDPDIAAAVQEATDRGSDVQLPSDKFVRSIVGTELGDRLTPDVRLTEDSLSAREVADRQAQAEAMFAQAMQVSDNPEVEAAASQFKTELDEIGTTIETQLKAVGKKAREAKDGATLVRKFFETQAIRLGISPKQLYEMLPVNVKDGSVQTPATAIAEITGDELVLPEGVSWGDLSSKERLDHIGNWLKSKAVMGEDGRYYITADNGRRVEIRKKGLKKAVYQAGQWRNYLSYAPAIPEIIAHGNWVEEALYKERQDGIVRFYKVSAPIKFKGEVVGLSVKVAEDGRGNFYYYLENPETKQATTELSDSTSRGQQPLGQGALASFEDNGSLNLAVEQLSSTTNRGTYSPVSLTIRLTPKADASTFLHETGHFFLDATMRLAQHPNATPQMLQDAQTLLDWFGVESVEAWNALGVEGQRPYHEQFAYNYERYLFEGKAPTGRLRELFIRFTEWLKSAYKDLVLETNAIYRRQFGRDLPQLSDDVRRVMDRLIASDTAVENAVRARALEPIVAQRDRGSMTEDEWAQYIVDQQEGIEEAKTLLRLRTLREAKHLVSRVEEERKAARAAAKNKRAEVRKKVTDELRLTPFYRAKHFLQTGELLNDQGEVVGRYQSHRLDASANTTKNAKIANLTARENGVSTQWVVDTFGLDMSPAEFVNALIEQPNFNDAVNSRVEQIMTEEFAHLEDPDVINQQVAEAISNEAFTRMIATEYKALRSASQPARVIAQYAKVAAESILNRTRFTDISSARYSRIEAKSRRQAERAMAKGDLQVAAEFKRQELLNHELARLSVEVETLKRRLSVMRREAFKSNNKLAKTRDIDHVQIVRALMAEYGMTTDTQAQSVDKAIDAIKANDADFAASLSNFIGGVRDAVGGRRGNQLTLADVRTIYTTLKAEWDLSRSSKVSLIDGQRMGQDQLLSELVKRFAEHRAAGRQLTAEPVPEGSATWRHKMVEKLLGLNAGLRRMESWCRAMDGAARGPFTRYLYEPIRDAVDAFNSKKLEANTRLKEILKTLDMTKTTYRAPELDNEHWPYKGLTKPQILHALLHCGNSSNKKKLLLGYGWGTLERDPVTGEERLDSSRWDAFVNRMVQEGVLTKTDFDAVQALWDLFDSIKPEAQKANKEIYGYYFDEVVAEPVVTPFGVYRGGYAPAIVDPGMVDPAQRQNMKEQLGMTGDSFMMPQAPNGFTKQRVENYTKPLLLDLGLLAGHVDKVLRFAYIAPRVREVYRLVGSSRSPLVKLIHEYDPRIVSEMIIPWLTRAQGQYVSKPSDATRGSKDVDNFWRILRTNSSMAVMAGNVLNTLQQYTGLSIAATRVKGKFLRRALVQSAAAPRESRSFVVTKSVWMRNRLEGNLFELSGEIESLITPGSKLRDARAWLMQHGYFMQQYAQNSIDVPVWMGAYAEAIDSGMSDRDAVRHADAVIRDTQGSFAPEDLSRFEAGTPAARLFTMFYSYFNMQYNLLATELGHAWIKRDYAHAAFVYFTALVVPTLVSRALMDAAGGLDTGDDDEFDAIDLLRVSSTEVAAANLALIPVLGNAVNYMFGLGRSDRYVPTPIVTTFETFGRLTGYLGDAADPDKDVNLRRATKDTLNAFSYLTGLPLGQFGKPLGYAVGLGTREFTAHDASDIVRGLISGRDVNQ